MPAKRAEIVEREVGAGDGVGALRGADAAHAAERRHVDPRVVVLGLRGLVVRVLVAVGHDEDAARVERRVHLDAERALPLLAAEEVAAVLQVLRLGAVRHLDGLRGAFVVERELLAAIPVRVVVPGLRAVALPLVVEVPDDLVAGLRIALAVDLVHRERLTGGVAGEARAGTDLRLARVRRRRVLVRVGRRVVAEERTDLELHALVEEEVAVRPELGRKERLQAVDLVDADHVAFLEGGRRRTGVLLGAGRKGKREAECEGAEAKGRSRIWAPR